MTVQLRRLAVDGSVEMSPVLHRDDRGVFLEWFTDASFVAATGHRLGLHQANCSVSSEGVLRGVHYADVPPGQAKYVTCLAGAVLDVVVDLRVGSPTFGRSDSVLLDDVDRRAVYLPEGVGHAFLSLASGSTVVYLCSAAYVPEREHAVNAFDGDLDITWPDTDRQGRPLTPRLSARDAAAPTLAEARARGLLPNWDACRDHVDGLRSTPRHPG